MSTILFFSVPGTRPCRDWEKYGFECVDQTACGDDGHFDALKIQAVIGIRHDDDNSKQVTKP